MNSVANRSLNFPRSQGLRPKAWAQSLDNDSCQQSQIFDSSYNVNTGPGSIGGGDLGSSQMAPAGDYEAAPVVAKTYFRDQKPVHLKAPRETAKKQKNSERADIEKMLNSTDLGAWRRSSIDIQREIRTADQTTRRYNNQNLKTIEFLEELQTSDKFNNVLKNAKVPTTDFVKDKIAEEVH